MVNDERHIAILGCGWLGLPLGRRLAGQGWRVAGSTTDASRFAEIRAAGIEPYRVELGTEIDGEGLGDFFAAPIMVVAIPPGRRRPDVEEHHPQQIAALRQRLDNSPVKWVIFVSSTSVYPASVSLATEDDPGPADTASGRALRRAEAILGGGGFALTVLRFGGLVGPGRHPAHFLAGRRDLPNADAAVNLIHLEDCLGIFEALLRRGPFDGILNAVTDGHPTRKAFYTSQALRLGLPAPTFIDSPSAEYKIVDNSRLKRLLGYRFVHPDPNAFPE